MKNRHSTYKFISLHMDYTVNDNSANGMPCLTYLFLIEIIIKNSFLYQNEFQRSPFDTGKIFPVTVFQISSHTSGMRIKQILLCPCYLANIIII